MNSCNLSNKNCVPCKGDVAPMKGEVLTLFLRQLGGGWKVVDEHHLEKEYFFKNFKEALSFVNKAGAIAEEEGHHPDMLLTYGKVNMKIFTHKIDGLTESDFILAAKYENLV